jgi:hypothetical protein
VVAAPSPRLPTVRQLGTARPRRGLAALLLVAAVVAALAALPSMASAAPGQLAQGSGVDGAVSDRFSFRAEGTLGAPTGSARFDFGNLRDITGTVDCLPTGARRAVVSGRINDPAKAFGFDRYTLVVDAVTGQPDRIDTFLANGNFCVSFNVAANLPLKPVARGGVIVQRAT